MIEAPDGTRKPRRKAEPEQVVREIAPALHKWYDLDFVKASNKDSTNIIPNDWNKIARAIYKRRDEFAGFVVMHGTDTMHFSATAVGFALGSAINSPVVFTGAQTTPTVTYGDARTNLERACKVATSELAEVVISFDRYVFRGCRAEKRSAKSFDAFESPAFDPLGEFEGGELRLENTAVTRGARNNEIEFRPGFEAGVMQISLVPGQDPSLLDEVLQSDRCHGIVLESFGAGNVPSRGPNSLLRVIERWTRAAKPIIVASQCPASATRRTQYEPGRKAIAAGALPIGNMTTSCAAVKLMWLLAQIREERRERGRLEPDAFIEEVRERMERVYIGEMDLED